MKTIIIVRSKQLNTKKKIGTHMKKILTTTAAAVLLGLATQANAAVELVNDGDTKVTLGGFVKVDARHVSGDLYRDGYFIGSAAAGDFSQTDFNANQSRLQFKVQHGEVTGVIEMDADTAEGNEIISNSSGFRIRHAFIKWDNWLVGQTWSTFMPLHALAETLDFGGAHVGEAFIRQSQIRYTSGGFSFALENPYTFGGDRDESQQSMPDVIARYDFKGDWGQANVGALFRKVDQSGIDETAIGFNAAAKIKMGGKNDLRVSVAQGEYGRYVGTVAVPDIITVNDETRVEEGTSFTAAYRVFWNESTRSTFFYGQSTTDLGDRDRSHTGVNVITNVTSKLKVGVELGKYSQNEAADLSSNYLLASAQFSF
jgi:hypothetical protein